MFKCSAALGGLTDVLLTIETGPNVVFFIKGIVLCISHFYHLSDRDS